ncbi:MAG: GNAT family N-acetyltransferase [Opitutaceae bacterium]|nr:GNAT family N-acetyltransferase [Opitutaceae bacterium]
MNAFIKLRPVDPDDEPFLCDLRAQVDSERLGLRYWSPGSEQMAQEILALQFKAHSAHYRKVKSNWDTKDCIIEFDGQRVGRFIVTQDAKVVHLADIAVHRDHRGKGIGQAVIDATKAECVQSKRTLRLHVDPLNPALQFYLQLGFRVIEQKPTHLLMEWAPPSLQGKKLYFPPGKA